MPVVVPAGPAGAELFHLAVMAWALLGFANVYVGAAERAYDLTVSSMRQRGAIGLTRTQAHHPEVQRTVAEMRMALESVRDHLGRVCDDWTNGVDHGEDSIVKLVTAKYLATTRAFEIVDHALDLAGGGGLFKRNRLEQLFRDVRLGRMHPANALATHEIVGKASLGVSPLEEPRWG